MSRSRPPPRVFSMKPSQNRRGLSPFLRGHRPKVGRRSKNGDCPLLAGGFVTASIIKTPPSRHSVYFEIDLKCLRREQCPFCIAREFINSRRNCHVTVFTCGGDLSCPRPWVIGRGAVQECRWPQAGRAYLNSP